MTKDAFTTVPTNIDERIADLDERILDARRLQYNASQMGSAAGVGRMERLLVALYEERDGLVKIVRAAPVARVGYGRPPEVR